MNKQAGTAYLSFYAEKTDHLWYNNKVMKEKVIIIRNESETEKFGIELAGKLDSGAVIALEGDLGTGKTTLTKSIARGLGIDDVITSPTFNIVKEYRSGRLPLFHFDVYRIGDVDEMYEIGYEEYSTATEYVSWSQQV